MARTGRPIEYDKETFDSIKSLEVEIRTDRGIKNRLLWLNCLDVVMKNHDIDNIEFLIDMKNKRINQMYIMVELGRLPSDEIILDVTKQVCEMAKTLKLTSKQWIQKLRNCRYLNYGSDFHKIS
jgi:hypothetical protein